MVDHFRGDLETLLMETYVQGKSLADPYELVKDFCIDGATKACENVKIPSVQRKKEQMKKLSEKSENEELEI